MSKYGLHIAIMPTSVCLGSSEDDSQFIVHVKRFKIPSENLKNKAASIKGEDSKIFIYPIVVETKDRDKNTENALCTEEEAGRTEFDRLYSFGSKDCQMLWAENNFTILIPDINEDGEFDIGFKSRGFRSTVKEGAADFEISMYDIPDTEVIEPHVTLFKCNPINFKSGDIIGNTTGISLNTMYTLKWEIENAKFCTVDGVKSKISGSKKFIADGPKRHSIIAYNSINERVEKGVWLNLRAPQIKFYSNRAFTYLNDIITLSWSVESATQISINPNVLPITKEIRGNKKINYDGTKKYILTTYGGYEGRYPKTMEQSIELVEAEWKKVGKCTYNHPLSEAYGSNKIWKYNDYYYLMAPGKTYQSKDLLEWTQCQSDSIDRKYVTFAVYNQCFHRFKTYKRGDLDDWTLFDYQVKISDLKESMEMLDIMFKVICGSAFIFDNALFTYVISDKLELYYYRNKERVYIYDWTEYTGVDAITCKGIVYTALRQKSDNKVYIYATDYPRIWGKGAHQATIILPNSCRWFKLVSGDDQVYLITHDGMYISGNGWEKWTGFYPHMNPNVIPWFVVENGKLTLLIEGDPPSNGHTIWEFGPVNQSYEEDINANTD